MRFQAKDFLRRSRNLGRRAVEYEIPVDPAGEVEGGRLDRSAGREGASGIAADRGDVVGGGPRRSHGRDPSRAADPWGDHLMTGRYDGPTFASPTTEEGLHGRPVTEDHARA